MKKEKLSYQKALDEIQDIIHQIENKDFPVDELTKKIKRVSFLIDFCKKNLHETETEISNLLENGEDE